MCENIACGENEKDETMFELLQKLIAFKYSCKMNHWKTDNYSHHLLFDRLQEDMDDIIDDVAEKYFMAGGKKSQIAADPLKSELIELDLPRGIDNVLKHIDTLLDSGEYTEGVQSLLSGIAEALTEKLALLSMK